MKELLELLKQQNLSIGSCESMTAGLFSDKLAEVSGASAVLKGAIVTYQTSVKINLVKVEKEIIDRYGVISEQCALQMAMKARSLLDCDICVSFSGNAGPSLMEEKPAGTVCCAIADADTWESFTLHLHGERNEIRLQAVDRMVEKIKNFIKR